MGGLDGDEVFACGKVQTICTVNKLYYICAVLNMYLIFNCHCTNSTK